jgi:hypothetical protein
LRSIFPLDVRVLIPLNRSVSRVSMLELLRPYPQSLIFVALLAALPV